jgi:DNA-binding transcriptional ArsR family regulator
MLSGGTLSSAPSGTRMVPSSSELIDAVGHPMRRRILQTLVLDAPGSVSADEIASALDQPLARVTYHLRTLARCEVLRASRTDAGNAAARPRYGWSLDVEAEWLRVVLDVWFDSRSAG